MGEKPIAIPGLDPCLTNRATSPWQSRCHASCHDATRGAPCPLSKPARPVSRPISSPQPSVKRPTRAARPASSWTTGRGWACACRCARRRLEGASNEPCPARYPSHRSMRRSAPWPRSSSTSASMTVSRLALDFRGGEVADGSEQLSARCTRACQRSQCCRRDRRWRTGPARGGGVDPRDRPAPPPRRGTSTCGERLRHRPVPVVVAPTRSRGLLGCLVETCFTLLAHRLTAAFECASASLSG